MKNYFILLGSGCSNLVLVFLIILLTSPAEAATSSKPNKSFPEQVQEAINSLKTYIKQLGDEFSTGWGELSSEVQQAIESSIGDLGIPDPVKAGKQIRVVIGGQKTDITTTDPGLQGQDAQHGWHQTYTLAHSQSILGKEGQKVQAKVAEISNNALLTSSDTSDAAQNDIVTQDILKKIATQNVQQAIISKSIQGEIQDVTQALATSNINLADISERMDEQALRQEFEDNASARQIIRSAAFADGFWEKKKP